MDDWMYAADAHGLLSLADARAAGLNPARARGLVVGGALTRIAHGWFAVGPVPTDEERHVLRTRAMLRSHGDRAVAGHHSGLLLVDLPTYDADFDTVRLTRRTPGPTTTKRGLSIGRSVPADWQRAETVQPALAVVQHGMSAGPLSALVAADAALRLGLVVRADLDAAMELVASHPRSAGVAAVIGAADGRHESPGETRLALALRLLGFRATPQVRIVAPGFTAIVDFLLDDVPVVVEFDGRVKYGRDDPDPRGRFPSGRVALWEEKRREDRLRELGYEVVRIVWSDLDDPRLVADRIMRAVARARRSA